MTQTHFGFETVDEKEKAQRVAGVFSSVAQKYDVMNDLMSAGPASPVEEVRHRNRRAAPRRARARRRRRHRRPVIGLRQARRREKTGQVWLTDINNAMLGVGRDRLLDEGVLAPAAQCDAEKLPFPDNHFDIVTVAFGLRNMTHKDKALAEMRRVLRPGGRLLVLEFSKVWKPLEKAYDAYSFKLLPWLGQKIAGDADSYRYLAESIRMHPDQATLKAMMEQAGLERVEVFNMTAGVVALHRGYKF
jgi:demethylmenaquinone methyltransferase/2-methoxy-6-polyprenyl-1,4-benzoquinol methylase